MVLVSQMASLMNVVLRDIVDRPRPSPQLVGVVSPLNDPSFSSGHAVQYTVLCGVVFFSVYVLARPSSRRKAALVALALPIVLVGRHACVSANTDSTTYSEAMPWQPYS